MEKIRRLREKYERKLHALDNKEQVLDILKWVAAAIAAAAFIFGVVKAIMLIAEKLNQKGICCADGCCDDCCAETDNGGEVCVLETPETAE